MNAKLLMTTALVAALAAPGVVAAQQSGTRIQGQQSAPSATQEMMVWERDDLLGMDLYGADSRQVGAIQDAVMDRDGKVQAVLVEVGSFLGIGGKRVVVPVAELQLVGDRIVAESLTARRIADMPEYGR